MQRIFQLFLLMVLLILSGGCDILDFTDENEEEELNGLYTEEEINYFTDIAFGFEYGSNTRKIRKWTEDIRIEVLGSPSPEDQQELDRVIKELNETTDPIQLHLVDEEPSTKMYFVHPEEYEEYLPDMHNPEADGYFRINYQPNCKIYKATILISTEVTQKRRFHLIREEVTQSLGITRDSYKYQDSIFYQLVSEVTEFAPIDKKVIEMLYRSDILPCMPELVAKNILESLE